MQEPESPPASPPPPNHRGKKRQKRTVYSIEQRLLLEEFYKKNHYGTYEERETLAKQAKVQEHHVQVWLKNRRAKDRRLQRLRRKQGQGAHAAPQEPEACAPQPGPAGPAFQGYAVLPASPVLSASSVFPEEPVFPAGPASPPSPNYQRKKRQKRTVYSIEQRLLLEEFYKKNHYGTYEERETLAKQVKVKEHHVQAWLNNRRTKDCRLQRLQGQQGQGAHALPQEPEARAPQPAPAGPAFQGSPVLSASPVFPEEPVFPAGPVLPASSVFPEEPVLPAAPLLPASPLHHGGPAFGSLPPHSPFEAFPEAEHCLFNYSQACWGPAQDIQGTVHAALAPASAQAGVWPQGPHHLSCSTNPVGTPRVTELQSPKGPLEGHFSSCQPWAEHDEDRYILLEL